MNTVEQRDQLRHFTLIVCQVYHAFVFCFVVVVVVVVLCVFFQSRIQNVMCFLPPYYCLLVDIKVAFLVTIGAMCPS